MRHFDDSIRERLQRVCLVFAGVTVSSCCATTVYRDPLSRATFVDLDRAAIAKLQDADSEARAIQAQPPLAALVAAVVTWDHKSDPAPLTTDSGAQIYARVSAKFATATTFTAWSPFSPWSSAIAKDDAGGVIAVNRRKTAQFSVDDYVGTIFHELAHKAGYLHDGNARKGNECTVPHLLGDAAVVAAHKQHTGHWGVLPSDACQALRVALAAQRL